MKKLTVLMMAVMAALGLYMYNAQADDVTLGSGVTRNYAPSRWQTARTAAAFTTVTIGTTNVLSTVPSEIGQITIVPGAVTDVLTIYNGTTVGSATNSALEIFRSTTNTAASVGMPVSYTFLSGLTASNGIVTVISSLTTNTTARAFIMWDVNR